MMAHEGQSPQEHLRTMFGEPLGWTKSGRPIWPIAGGAPDDDSTGGGEVEDDENDDDGAGSGSGDDDSGDDRDPKRKISALTEEKDRHFRKAQAAEQRAKEAEARVRELEEKDLGEAEKTVRERDELKDVNEQLSQRVNDLALENAFLTDNTFQWHNPKRALKLVDLSEVEIGDDGTVKGLDKALKALAESDSYLVKTATDGDQQKDLPPGGSKKNGKKQDQTTPDAEKLRQKYPALRR